MSRRPGNIGRIALFVGVAVTLAVATFLLTRSSPEIVEDEAGPLQARSPRSSSNAAIVPVPSTTRAMSPRATAPNSVPGAPSVGGMEIEALPTRTESIAPVRSPSTSVPEGFVALPIGEPSPTKQGRRVYEPQSTTNFQLHAYCPQRSFARGMPILVRVQLTPDPPGGGARRWINAMVQTRGSEWWLLERNHFWSSTNRAGRGPDWNDSDWLEPFHVGRDRAVGGRDVPLLDVVGEVKLKVRAHISLEPRQPEVEEQWFLLDSEVIEIDIQDPPPAEQAALAEIMKKKLLRRHYGGGGENASPPGDTTDLQAFVEKYAHSIYAPYALLELSMSGVRPIEMLERVRLEHSRFAYSDLVLFELVERSLHRNFPGTLEFIGARALGAPMPPGPTPSEIAAAGNYARELESRFPGSWYATTAKRRVEEALAQSKRK